MPKNIVIFSDGTGQAGGLAFDEDRSNIYKLYRAARVAPDSSINPSEQVAYYDAGLGSKADGDNFSTWLTRWIYNLVSQATGFGITANMIDCYAALIRLYRDGDRIFLFGFSRGAYTVRCLAGVICFCGMPRHLPGNKPLPLDIAGSRKLASYAVKHIYQFTESRRYESATPEQQFDLDTRDLIAKRFREEHGSAAQPDEKDPKRLANIYPYFVGVFDTVASLGSFSKSLLFAVLFSLAAFGVSAVAYYLSYFPETPLIGGFLSLITFWGVFRWIFGAAAAVAVAIYFYTHIKLDFRVPGYNWWQKLRTVHLTELWQKFYDNRLNDHVTYAKHAISIDENRKDFKREPWGQKDSQRDKRDVLDNPTFEQVWFAGNHSDIGGSYLENESRLSDITLKWMVDVASVIPDGFKYDDRVLNLHCGVDGVQHDEVAIGFGLATKLWSRINWSEQARELPIPNGEQLSPTNMHPTVYQRFDLREVPLHSKMGPYRPTMLAKHKDFARYYEPGAAFPADSRKHATCLPVIPARTKNRSTKPVT